MPEGGDQGWPYAAGQRVIFLLDAASGIEQRLLRQWIDEHRPDATNGCSAVPIPPSRQRRRRPLDPRLEAALVTDDDPLMAPLRVAWFPGGDDGARAARLSDLLTFGDPRDPGAVRQAWVSRRHPERSRVVIADPAPLSDLRRRWQQAGGSDIAHTTGLADFIARQAGLALERSERRLRGSRYKVPRFVYEDILGRPSWRAGCSRLASQLSRQEDAVRRDAARYLREIAATHSPTSSTSPRTSSTCSTRAAIPRRCTTIATSSTTSMCSASATRWSFCRRTNPISITSCCSTCC